MRRRALFVAAILVAMLGCNNRQWNSGDRVLVSKFAYDAGLSDPKQFQVVVFKYPKQPVENGVPKNYIKRLLGLPGQILAIFLGQLFYYEPEDAERPHDDTDPDVDPHDLWKKKYMHAHDPKLRELFDVPGKFRILRKPPEVMLALRRIVYDNDYPARDLVGKLPPRWSPAANSNWGEDGLTAFVHNGNKAGTVDWLRYQHITRSWEGGTRDRKPELINDFMDYNAGVTDPNAPARGGFGSPNTGSNWVGDLMVEAQVTIQKGEGEFWLELSKGPNRFQARFDLADGECTLYKVSKNGSREERKELGRGPTKLRGSGDHQVRLANFDSRLTLWVDGDLPFDDGAEYPPPEIRNKGEEHLDKEALARRRGPVADNDLQPASVGSQGASVKITHLRLWRDTYYTQYDPPDGQVADLPIHDWADPKQWGPADPQVTCMYVQPGHYLCLGDNSPASSDSRDWGVVPSRLLLGRALLVYFPMQRAGPIR